MSEFKRRESDNQRWYEKEFKWVVSMVFMLGAILLSVGGGIVRFNNLEDELDRNEAEDKVVHSSMTEITIEHTQQLKAIEKDVSEMRVEQREQKKLLIEILRAVK